jgi:hypothetical protein
MEEPIDALTFRTAWKLTEVLWRSRTPILRFAFTASDCRTSTALLDVSKQALSCILIGGSLLTQLIVSANASDSKLKIVREVVLQSSPAGAVIEPNVISRADDGGFIVAGSIRSRRQAWASKVDAEGKSLWSYVTAPQLSLPIGDGAEFYGAATMPDGTTYLCGFMPRAPDAYAPALLVHLDREGRMLDERRIVPEGHSERGYAGFYDCARWQGGVAMVGAAFNVIRTASWPDTPNPVVDRYYFVLGLNEVGTVVWERHIPTTFNAIDEVGPLLTMRDSSLVFSASRIDATEFFRVSSTGKLIAQGKTAGLFRFERPIAPDNLLRLFGYMEDGVASTIWLDQNLLKTNRLIS